jgi:hypothetical protein
MKRVIPPCLVFCIMLPQILFAQTSKDVSSDGLSTQNHPPAQEAYIVSFHAQNKGPLHINYSDGTEVNIPQEKGRFSEDEHPLTQEAFSDIHVADDHQHIGWLAEYMLCAQSYPCPAELVVYRYGHKLKYIRPSYGIVWRWKFLEAGKLVVVQFGFPHGDETGTFALYDTKAGKQIAEFYPEKKEAPAWVQQLQQTLR